MNIEKCLVCETSLEGKQSAAKFCSKKCSDMWNSSRFGGKGLRVFILKRDNYTCVECGSTDRPEVHHIDENPDHNEESNLITLCGTCHRRKHRLGKNNNKYKEITKEQVENAISKTSSLEEAALMLGITRKTLAEKRKMFGMLKMSNARSGEQNKNYKHLTVNEIRMAFEIEGSWERAAKRLCVSASFLRKRRLEMGVTEYKNRLEKSISKEDIDDAISRTATMQEAANLLGITRKTLAKKRKEFDLPQYDKYRNELNK